MIARECPAEFRDEVADFEHRGAKRRYAFGRKEVEVDSAMDAAFAEMAIIGRRIEAVTIEELHEASQERAQPRRRCGAILGTGPCTRTTGDICAGAQAGLADAPNCALVGGLRQYRPAGTFAHPGGLFHPFLPQAANLT